MKTKTLISPVARFAVLKMVSAASIRQIPESNLYVSNLNPASHRRGFVNILQIESQFCVLFSYLCVYWFSPLLLLSSGLEG